MVQQYVRCMAAAPYPGAHDPGKASHILCSPTHESGTGASIHISTFLTGCTNSTLLACRQIPPSGFDLGAPYFKSPFMWQPMSASWQRIW